MINDNKELEFLSCKARIWAARMKAPQILSREESEALPTTEVGIDKFELNCLGPWGHNGMHEFLGSDGRILAVPEEMVHYW